MAGFNWFLIIVAVVVAAVAVGVAVYMLVEFQHADDKNDAWAPKAVVVLSIALSIYFVGLYPMDVLNRGSCEANISLSDCSLALPMRVLWIALYYCMMLLSLLVIPFTMFWYEADSDSTTWQKVRSAGIYTFLAFGLFVIITVILFVTIGFVDFPTQHLDSGMVLWSTNFVDDVNVDELQGFTACIDSGSSLLDGAAVMLATDGACDWDATTAEGKTFTQDAGISVFVVSLFTGIGWLLFMIFAGVGMVALPVDMVMRFLGRPQKTITKTEYMSRAKEIANRAKKINETAVSLRAESRGDKKQSSKQRKQTAELSKFLMMLEDDAAELQKLYPQDTDREATWVMYVISFWVSLFAGIGLGIVGLLWFLHVCIYLLPGDPPSPFLNGLFIALDSVWTLLGIIIFGVFCLYLMLATLKGFVRLGLNFGLFAVYPMRRGATVMSSLLVNSALMLMSATAVVQFCVAAFQAYAAETAISVIFGVEIGYLRGMKHLFQHNAFIIIMIIMNGLTVLFFLIRGPKAWKRKPPETIEL